MRHLRLFENYLKEGKLQGEIHDLLISKLLPKRPNDAFLQFVIGNKIQPQSLILSDWDQIPPGDRESLIFDEILPDLMQILLNHQQEPSMITRNLRTQTWEIFWQDLEIKPTRLKTGWHYTQRDNLEKILKEGIQPAEISNFGWAPSAFIEGEEMRGLWPGKRCFFYRDRDDLDAMQTFGDGLVALEVNLEGIQCWEDTTYIGDEEEISPAVWCKDVISPERVLQKIELERNETP